jgi:hypothetical protein
LTVPKQSSEQGEGVLSQNGIDEAFLSFEGLDCAAAWFSMIVESRIDRFRIELPHSP